MTLSDEEAFQAELRNRAPRAADDFAAAVRPIFGADRPDGLPEHVGCCILLSVDGRRILSTAAHLAEQLSERELFVGGPTGTSPVPIAGKWKATIPPGGNRHADHYDCAFWQVPDDAVESLGPVEFLESDRLALKRVDAVGSPHTAIGYPVKRNEGAIDHAARTIVNRRSIYTAAVIKAPRLAAKLGVTGADHLFLSFGKHAFDVDGKRFSSFKPTGMSGGALLDLGFTSSAAPTQARLSGMLIEYHRSHNALVAVKIGPIIEGIRRVVR